MKRILFAAALLSLTTACGGGGGTGSGVRSLTIEPKAFVASGPASPTPITERFTNGCATVGNPASNNAIDPRLQPGQQFSMSYEFSDSSGYKALAGTKLITSVTANTVQATYNLTAQTNFPVPTTFNETCTRTGPDQSGTYKWTCNDPAIGTMAGANECSVETQSTDAFTTSEVPGTFNGRQAYWSMETFRGQIKCGNVLMGSGVGTFNIVFSNQIPGVDINYCGGSIVFIGVELKLDTGKIVQSATMTTDGPHAL